MNPISATQTSAATAPEPCKATHAAQSDFLYQAATILAILVFLISF